MSNTPKMDILVVDDDAQVLESINVLLSLNGYRVVPCSGPKEAIEQFQSQHFDAVLTDIRMPETSGIGLLELIHEINPEIPVILITGYAELETAIDAIKKGAFDFITKPYRSDHLIHSVEKAVNYNRLTQVEKNYMMMLEETVKKRTQEYAEALTMLRQMGSEIMRRLTSVAEFRDPETGVHIVRIGMYAREVARQMGMPHDFIDNIAFAGSLHDIGKIGIPDRVLLKPGRLTLKEFEVIKTHTSIGERILAGSQHESIQMAAVTALAHHERCDGSGYPHGLRGQEIPIEGRIVNLCDQYDALRSNRPYKVQLTHDQVVRILTEGDGRSMPCHFDPTVLSAFSKVASVFEDIFQSYQD